MHAAERSALDRLWRRGLPVSCGEGRKPLVALTFDDGPGPYSRRTLELLRRHGQRATFFLVGSRLRYWSSLPRAERAVAALGNHSWTHRDLTSATSSELRWELLATQTAIRQLAGSPIDLFRPPYGARDAAVDRAARELGLVQVLWSIDSQDSLGAGWRAIAAAIERDVRPGSIILLHENDPDTYRALRDRILPLLERRGLRSVTVPELLALDPPTVERLRDGWGGCQREAAPRPTATSRAGQLPLAVALT